MLHVTSLTYLLLMPTERITPRDDSFFPSHIKDSFKMNESFKNDPSLVQKLAKYKLSKFYFLSFSVYSYSDGTHSLQRIHW